MITQEDVVKKLKTIYDPEIPVDIYELGLIYDIALSGNDIGIVMTLTTATCPAAAFMPDQIKDALLSLNGVQNVFVDVVYEPRWTRDRMSDQAKSSLGFS